MPVRGQDDRPDSLSRLRPYLIVPLITLVGVSIIVRSIGVVMPEPGLDWTDAVRVGLGAMLAITTVIHVGPVWLGRDQREVNGDSESAEPAPDHRDRVDHN